jgi:hypothetical protein
LMNQSTYNHLITIPLQRSGRAYEITVLKICLLDWACKA